MPENVNNPHFPHHQLRTAMMSSKTGAPNRNIRSHNTVHALLWYLLYNQALVERTRMQEGKQGERKEGEENRIEREGGEGGVRNDGEKRKGRRGEGQRQPQAASRRIESSRIASQVPRHKVLYVLVRAAIWQHRIPPSALPVPPFLTFPPQTQGGRVKKKKKKKWLDNNTKSHCLTYHR